MLRTLVLTIMIFTLALPALAKPKSSGSQVQEEYSTAERLLPFSAAERNIIRSHLLNERRNAPQPSLTQLPRGLQKKVARGKALPPGWQKKLAPGEHLDYSVYREGGALPDDLLRRLPPIPVGTEILMVEDKIMRLNSATRTILDIFDLTQSY